MSGRLMHVMLHVGDMDRSLAFYRMLGLKVQVDRGSPADERRNLFLGFGPEAEHALIELASPCPAPAPDFGHVALQVPDVAALCARLAAAGVAIVRAPRRLASGSVTAFVADPDGHRIELVQPPVTVVRTDDGVSLPVIAQGDGPALVLLHGGASRAGHFGSLMALLPDLRTIAFDQRGFGASRVPDHAEVSHARWATDVLAVMDALGIGRAALLGWSMGASVAINAAAAAPERIAGVVLLGAPDPARPVDVAALGRRLEEDGRLTHEQRQARDAASLRTNLGPAAAADEALIARLLEEREATPPAMAARTVAGFASRPDLRQVLPRLACPVHLVTGELDRICPPAGAHAVQALVPGATLDLVPGCGHYLAVEAPEAIAGIVAHRLASTGAS